MLNRQLLSGWLMDRVQRLAAQAHEEALPELSAVDVLRVKIETTDAAAPSEVKARGIDVCLEPRQPSQGTPSFSELLLWDGHGPARPIEHDVLGRGMQGDAIE